MKKIYNLIFILLLIPTAHAEFLKNKITIGRVEWIEFPDLKLKFSARIDTGAKTSSLHAFNIEEVKQRGEVFVKFQTLDQKGQIIELTRKVESTQKVANPTGFSTKRYVIKEKIKLGSYTREISINLNDRTKMSYKLLIGRNLLMGRFLVDVARSHFLGD
jgi:ribosomal protein S6--L-glutamate ligase